MADDEDPKPTQPPKYPGRGLMCQVPLTLEEAQILHQCVIAVWQSGKIDSYQNRALLCDAEGKLVQTVAFLEQKEAESSQIDQTDD